MSRPSGIGAGLLMVLILGGMTAATFADEALWRKPYTNEQATGEQVVALWQFKPGAETQDNSGHGHALTLRGETRFAEDGLFGKSLVIPPARTEGEDTPQGAQVPHHADLTPHGAFTLELWIQPAPELYDQKVAFLLDKKYIYYTRDDADPNHDYCLFFQKSRHSNEISLFAGLGVGVVCPGGCGQEPRSEHAIAQERLH